MTMRSKFTPLVSRRLLSKVRRQKKRVRAEKRRRREGRPHEVLFFHQVDDPYSLLLAQALLRLRERYEVEVQVHLVPPPDDWAAPERARLRSWSLTDAGHLARRSGLELPAAGSKSDVTPGEEASRKALEVIGAAIGRQGDDLLQITVDVTSRLWAGEELPEDGGVVTVDVDNLLAASADLRKRLGHYLGATCWYEGEWTWGIDRLLRLEQRLRDLGVQREGAPPDWIWTPPPDFAPSGSGRSTTSSADLPPLDWYLSFRSPYTAVLAPRLNDFVEHWGVELRLRPVLPMVMRGLPVDRSKGQYILRDAADEAVRQGVDFGHISDPVGRPVERGYSLLPWAIEQGRGLEYCQAFLRGVWARGIDADTDRGLARIVEDAGLPWSEARVHLGSDEWRSVAEANRRELLDLGLWGVPCLRAGDCAVWGQDRLWVIDDYYASLAG